jgi:hypothetical protein
MSFSFLPQQTGPLLCFGTFQAVKDEVRGKQIRDRCEANGWTRPPRKTVSATQPVASQPVATQAVSATPAPSGPATTQPATSQQRGHAFPDS